MLDKIQLKRPNSLLLQSTKVYGDFSEVVDVLKLVTLNSSLIVFPLKVYMEDQSENSLRERRGEFEELHVFFQFLEDQFSNQSGLEKYRGQEQVLQRICSIHPNIRSTLLESVEHMLGTYISVFQSNLNRIVNSTEMVDMSTTNVFTHIFGSVENTSMADFCFDEEENVSPHSNAGNIEGCLQMFYTAYTHLTVVFGYIDKQLGVAGISSVPHQQLQQVLVTSWMHQYTSVWTTLVTHSAEAVFINSNSSNKQNIRAQCMFLSFLSKHTCLDVQKNVLRVFFQAISQDTYLSLLKQHIVPHIHELRNILQVQSHTQSISIHCEYLTSILYTEFCTHLSTFLYTLLPSQQFTLEHACLPELVYFALETKSTGDILDYISSHLLHNQHSVHALFYLRRLLAPLQLSKIEMTRFFMKISKSNTHLTEQQIVLVDQIVRQDVDSTQLQDIQPSDEDYLGYKDILKFDIAFQQELERKQTRYVLYLERVLECVFDILRYCRVIYPSYEVHCQKLYKRGVFLMSELPYYNMYGVYPSLEHTSRHRSSGYHNNVEVYNQACLYGIQRDVYPPSSYIQLELHILELYKQEQGVASVKNVQKHQFHLDRVVGMRKNSDNKKVQLYLLGNNSDNITNTTTKEAITHDVNRCHAEWKEVHPQYTLAWLEEASYCRVRIQNIEYIVPFPCISILEEVYRTSRVIETSENKESIKLLQKHKLQNTDYTLSTDLVAFYRTVQNKQGDLQTIQVPTCIYSDYNSYNKNTEDENTKDTSNPTIHRTTNARNIPDSAVHAYLLYTLKHVISLDFDVLYQQCVAHFASSAFTIDVYKLRVEYLLEREYLVRDENNILRYKP